MPMLTTSLFGLLLVFLLPIGLLTVILGCIRKLDILSFYAPITAAFCEEFFYRGFAITTLGSILGNFWLAGIISCFAFAFLHLPYFKLGGVVQIGAWALFPMILFIITGSIYPGLIMHFLNNIFAYILRPLFLMKSTGSEG